jgi:hypothetical protein
VAIVSAIFSYVLAGYIFGGEDAENLEAPIVQEIKAEFTVPEDDSPYYNIKSINPTKVIEIGIPTDDEEEQSEQQADQSSDEQAVEPENTTEPENFNE